MNIGPETGAIVYQTMRFSVAQRHAFLVSFPPQFSSALFGFSRAGVAELVDATDLKSVGRKLPCRFDSGHRHHWNSRQQTAKGHRRKSGHYWGKCWASDPI
jgi:hypothetical protein